MIFSVCVQLCGVQTAHGADGPSPYVRGPQPARLPHMSQIHAVFQLFL